MEEEAAGEAVDFRVTVREVRETEEAADFPVTVRGAVRGRRHPGGSRREESRRGENRLRRVTEAVYSEARRLPRGIEAGMEARRPRRGTEVRRLPRGMEAGMGGRRVEGLYLEDG